MTKLLSVRLVAILVGLGFAVAALWAFVVGAYNAATEEVAPHLPYEDPMDLSWSFDGPFGKWDHAQLQRGLKVYDEVCSACHSLKFVAFRDLEQLGYSEGQVKAYAAAKQVPGIDPNTGEATMRPGLPTDYFPSPYPNAVAAAAANNNAIPPDLSLMTKARGNGTNYVASLLMGYQEPSAELLEEHPEAAPGPGLYHNPYFPNLNLAMAPPITTAGQVTYDDGTEATIEQMSKDVAAFLTWTAEPTMVKRKQTGWPVLIFLLFATILAYMSKKQIWAAVKPKK
ncbi:cytochrome c1 [Qipengyuania huizhouensis]|jgi:ubiquinol-cytochrome c reductase cytochrome c1 subunit|uniref:cytochrome c1 n=1 Tax=Qipengyuania huizhouensis TaxID=2867245 RepID=UPI0017B1A1A7|nr:cytochrome c1 [Qipengyuania huizhouensis]MBA4764306.1 cytochrome c1 [Erythrobacter sp.]MBL4857728.1 cytochrome c1 [Erythrobacter sp.]MBX7460016.1 cytochrome c1 [Qipengyuania huizhouensis]